MSESVGGPPRPICPIISAVSELKQFSDYPRCNPECGWYDTAWNRCAIRSIAVAIEDVRSEIGDTSRNVLSGVDWQTKQDISNGLRGLAQVLEHAINKIT